ncbi:MAG: phytanoyl-CoA dioxygenase family protein [Phycisphaeraceae bacterium]|nr:phytanoyl-CoA dioxygenase family protein [Phycisphaeraceae bacterium]
MATPSEHDIFFFDLRGYLHLRGALSPEEVAQINAGLDVMPRLKPGQWWGHVHGHRFSEKDGINYQQIYEAGPAFENLIDHPAWFDLMKTFVGGEGTFDHNHGPLFIDENFANFRGPGEAIPLHSGGHMHCSRTQFACHDGKFHCNQVNILIALADIGPGDGCTMLVPASHKSNFDHPDIARYQWANDRSVDGLEGAVEMHMRAGDALLFVDAIMHGSARRANPGQRRILVYRYGPSWGNFRHGYQPSPELLARLTPQRRQIVWPQQNLRPTPETDLRTQLTAAK